MAAKDRIRAYFEANVGKVVSSEEIRKVGEISEWARRVRELRNEEGMQIKSHVDRADLKPGEYILETLKLVPVIARNVSQRLRNEIMERNGFTCQLCGASAADQDPFNQKRRVRLQVDHIIPISQGGTNVGDNLRVLCTTCNLGRANVEPPSESAKNLIARLRRAKRSVRNEVYELLKREFESD